MSNARLVDAAENFMLFTVSPDGGHRECPSDVLVCFPSESSLRAAETMFAQRPLSFESAIAAAAAIVSDPDLPFGDFGVDVRGRTELIPAGVRVRIEQANSMRDRRMGKRGVLPADLRSESLEWMAVAPAGRV